MRCPIAHEWGRAPGNNWSSALPPSGWRFVGGRNGCPMWHATVKYPQAEPQASSTFHWTILVQQDIRQESSAATASSGPGQISLQGMALYVYNCFLLLTHILFTFRFKCQISSIPPTERNKTSLVSYQLMSRATYGFDIYSTSYVHISMQMQR